eukprot:Ihof_evm3s455 gene=Ihof_evmTU3s455
MEGSTTPAPDQANLIGNYFVLQYYRKLNSNPTDLVQFYGDQSQWCHSDESDEVEGAKGQQRIVGKIAIGEAITHQSYEGSRVMIKAIGCQPSLQSSIIILVTGLLFNPMGTPRRFAHTFLLAASANGKSYYLMNDMLRLTLEDESLETNETQEGEGQVVVEAESSAVPTVPAKSNETAYFNDQPLEGTTQVSDESDLEPRLATEPSPVIPTQSYSESCLVTEPSTGMPAQSDLEHRVATESSPIIPVESQPPMGQLPAVTPSPTLAAPAMPVSLPVDTPTIPQEPPRPKTFASITGSNINHSTVSPVYSNAAPAVHPTTTPVPGPVKPTRLVDTSAGSTSGFGAKTKAPGLFVQNVPVGTTEDQLKAFFANELPAPFSVESAAIVRDKGYAFVNLNSSEAVTHILEHGPYQWEGVVLSIQERRGDSSRTRIGGNTYTNGKTYEYREGRSW